MKIVVVTCLIAIIPAILCTPDDDCPMCDRNQLRCGPNCLQLDDQDELGVKPLRQVEGKMSSVFNRGYVRNGDMLCINFPSKSKMSRLGMEGFVLNNGKVTPLKELLDMAHSRQGYKDYFKSPYDSRNENVEMKQVLDDINGYVLGRGGWDKLSPPWG